MRKRIEALADQLEELVSEDEHDLHWIDCPDEAVALVAAAIDLNEQRGSRDASIVLLAPGTDAEEHAARLLAELEACAAGLALPAPSELQGRTLERCLVWADHVATLLATQERRLVLWLLPTQHESVPRLEPILGALLRAPSIASRSLRVASRTLGHPASTSTAVRARTISFEHSTAEYREALREDAEDASRPRAARTASALALAMADAAEGRSREALVSLARIADRHLSPADASTRALCFALAGPVLARIGELDEARVTLRRALGLSVCSPPVALSTAFSLGHVAVAQDDLAEADACFELAARTAQRLGRPAAVSHALLLRADVAARADDEPRRHAALVCGATAAARAGDVALLREALVTLQALLVDRADDAGAEAVATHLASLPHGPAHVHSAGEHA